MYLLALYEDIEDIEDIEDMKIFLKIFS